MDHSRRRLLQAAGLAGVASGLPGVVQRALAIPAQTRFGDVRDIEHIVVFMQENRAFDHYFGAFNGVRGHGDPRPLGFVEGFNVWRQAAHKDQPEHPDGYVLPFHGDSKTTNAYVVDGANQGHQDNLTIYDGGRWDRWGDSRQLNKRMTYYTAADLPYYYALASAFTICDAYHCSTLTQTYPNRLHLWTGCNGGGKVGGDPIMSNYGEDQTPWADQAMDQPLAHGPLTWTTYAERLERAGVSWKVYQEYDNFSDNILSIFAPFRPAPKGSPYYERGRAWVSEHETDPELRRKSTGEYLIEAFRRDVAAGALPQVSWIVTAADLSEHPTAAPAKGEHICDKLIEALVDHPEVFAKTVFIINYDEAGGFFDHMPPPTPPLNPQDGFSTVSVAGEAKIYGAGEPNIGTHPIGLGVRTPTIVVSPWTRGGHVCSQVFDHTSVLRLMEARFGVREENISDWRRSVCGDLTSCFDFKSPNQNWAELALPSTEDYLQRFNQSAHAPSLRIPETQRPSNQAGPQRASRALPYRLEVDGRWRDGRLEAAFDNRGQAGAAFLVHAAGGRVGDQGPWRYTVGAEQAHAASPWAEGAHDVTVYGPDGLFRRFRGDGAPLVEAAIRQARGRDALVRLENRSDRTLEVRLVCAPAYAAGRAERTVRLNPRESREEPWPLEPTQGWYDLTIVLPSAPGYERRFAGRYHDGRPSLTDPGIGAMVL